MPGVQNPHCDAAVASNAATSASRTSASSPSSVVTARARDPGDGRHARDAGLAVDEHRAAPALALRCAAVLHVAATEVVAERLEERAGEP